MTDRLNNKIAIITGSGSGIGEATAKLFAEEGAKVVIAEINSENGKKVSDEINDKGGESIFIETDVSQSDSVKSMVDQTVSKLGTPDILINTSLIDFLYC